MDDTMAFIEEKLFEQFGAPVKLICDTHGEYDGREREEWPCPQCDDIKKRESNIRAGEANKRAVLAARWEKCGMTKKFCGITLDEWIAETPNEKIIKQAARDFINGKYKRMLLIGNCGTGKTMLAAGIIGEMSLIKIPGSKKDNSMNSTEEADLQPVYTTATRLLRTIRDTWSSKESEQKAMDYFINCDILVIDELGAGRCSDDDRLILSEILCDRYSSDMPTLLISNLNGEALKKNVIDERAADRMREDGKIVAITGTSKRREITEER
jgi:DNA replication protein DnaC